VSAAAEAKASLILSRCATGGFRYGRRPCTDTMDAALNHEYLAMKACSLGAGVVLDFGCGKAHVVSLLRSRGIAAYGADVFWGGMNWGEDDGPYRQLLSAGIVREIVDGKIPFEDATFDVIVSDQVFEHVDDFAGAAAEMVRVLKPTGRMYHQCPPKISCWSLTRRFRSLTDWRGVYGRPI
jgi:SAM-dependent methyltransferase